MAEFKTQKYEDRTFQIYKRDECTILIKSEGLEDGLVYVDKHSGKLYGASYGVCPEYNSKDEALIGVFSNMIKYAPIPQNSLDKKCKELGEFYNKLEDENS